MIIPRFRLLAVCAALCMPLAHADAPQDALKHFVDGIHTLQADFRQVQTDEKGRVVKSQTGHMWLSRPGKFRWSYQKPYEQLIVCDGRKIWVYDPDLKQVTVRPAKEALTGSPAALLSQKAALKDAFKLEDGGNDLGVQTVRLLPKSKDSDFKSIELSLRDGVPERMVFHDQLGDATDITFSNLKSNAAIPVDTYVFKPPAGVEVVGSGASDPD